MAKDKLNGNMLKRFKKFNTKYVDYSVTLFQLYIKYKGICQECKCITTFGAHPTVENSATIEHIIPLSEGGNHVWDNTTLLCQTCNYDKNHKRVYSAMAVKENVLTIEYKKLFSLFGYEIFYKKES